MYIKKAHAATDQRLRSLLQKAVRRGADDLVDRTARRLLALGDGKWIRSRAVVITFEESWPLAEKLVITKNPETKIQALHSVTARAKQKDAAGLGALAYAFHEGDRTMEDLVPSMRNLRIVAEALDRRSDFFAWVRRACSSAPSLEVVRVAEKYLSVATWEWDKATILAGALLAAESNEPVVLPSTTVTEDLPLWVALDKHTAEGKAALQELSRASGLPYRALIWASFYCESTKTNLLSASPWFEAERTWRLRRAGLTLESAELLWASVRREIAAALDADAVRLQAELASTVASHQRGLFVRHE